LITTAKGQHLLVDTAPELRLQILQAGIRSVEAVLYTHMHADHTHGFDDLRAFFFKSHEPVHVYLLPQYREELKQRFAYAFQDTGYLGTKPQIEVHDIPRQPFAIGESLIEPVVLPHGNVESCAFRVGRFAYATDFKEFSPDQIAAWRGKVDVMVASGIHFGQHRTHSTIPETLALFAELGVKQGYITHLSHEVDQERDAHRLPDNVKLAYDGMVIDL
jgi:phosphoribosyl 1,2-cyclic phosphate phosphodiesterase